MKYLEKLIKRNPLWFGAIITFFVFALPVAFLNDTDTSFVTTFKTIGLSLLAFLSVFALLYFLLRFIFARKESRNSESKATSSKEMQKDLDDIARKYNIPVDPNTPSLLSDKWTTAFVKKNDTCN